MNWAEVILFGLCCFMSGGIIVPTLVGHIDVYYGEKASSTVMITVATVTLIFALVVIGRQVA